MKVLIWNLAFNLKKKHVSFQKLTSFTAILPLAVENCTLSNVITLSNAHPKHSAGEAELMKVWIK
jgi:hypothetical protein